MAARDFLTKEEQTLVVKAIESAELRTSGEIRVHIESICKGDPVERAIKVFNLIGMHKTEERNGVLIYIAWRSRKFAIIGDLGIDRVVPEGFWDCEKNILMSHLKEGSAAAGLVKIIEIAGEKLKEFFPLKEDDKNEQSNEISFGE